MGKQAVTDRKILNVLVILVTVVALTNIWGPLKDASSDVGDSSIGRAPDCGSGGCGFEPRSSTHIKDINMCSLDNYKGNTLTSEEKQLRLKYFSESLKSGEIDIEMVPFLEAINKFDFIMTTQCCCGHGENAIDGGRKAHLDFRCSLPVEKVIDSILRPLAKKSYYHLELELEKDRLRYILWMENEEYKEVLVNLIDLLHTIKE